MALRALVLWLASPQSESRRSAHPRFSRSRGVKTRCAQARQKHPASWTSSPRGLLGMVPLRIFLDGLKHPDMREAAAQHARERLLNFFFAGFGAFVQERLGGENHAVHAKPALRGLFIDERLLDGMRLLRCSQPFQSGDLQSLRALHGRYARADSR